MGRRPYVSTVCEDCGQQIVRRIRPDKPALCGDCAESRVILAAQQMAAKSGPAWDKWLSTNGPAGRPRRGRQEG
jgi:hypothetical protein